MMSAFDIKPRMNLFANASVGIYSIDDCCVGRTSKEIDLSDCCVLVWSWGERARNRSSEYGLLAPDAK